MCATIAEIQKTTKKEFKDIVDKYLTEEKNYNKSKKIEGDYKKGGETISPEFETCEDNWLGVAIYPSKRKGFDFSDAKFCPNKRIKFYPSCYIGRSLKEMPKIIIVLESPHNEEYEHEPPMPALGGTGLNLCTYFEDTFNDWIENNKITPQRNYDVILMNAIQHQTSLGVPTDNFRDDVFKKCWEKFGKENFKERLKCYIGGCKRAFIINMCTGSKNENKNIVTCKGLSKLVQDEIDALYKSNKNIKRLRCNHPAYWHIQDEAYRKIDAVL